MLQELLTEARAQAERSAPAVKAAAVLHIARVLTKVNPAEAPQLLDQGVALAAMLPDDDRDILMGEAAALAATVTPVVALRLVRTVSADRDSVLSRAIVNMLDHGHVGDAVDYLSDPVPGEVYPFIAARQAMSGRFTDDEARLRVFRGAIRAMRGQHASDQPADHRRHHSIGLFTSHWMRLPADEAGAVVRELVEWILSEPDARTSSGFGGGPHEVHFSSTHEAGLFRILDPLRHLDPDLAESVVKPYPQLSAAAGRFPYGMESIITAGRKATQPPAPRERVEQPHYIDVGRRLIPIPEAIQTEFKDAFALALDLYADDSDPENVNEAPQSVWPSALEFRKILYSAGRHEGVAAARYRDRIPDPALRLFAQIELAAALAGLPKLGGRSIRSGPRHLREMMRQSPASTSVAPPPMNVLPPPRKPDLPPSRELRISPATLPADHGPSGGSGSDFVEIRNASLKAVVSKLFDMPETRIDWPASLDPDARYDFVLVLPHLESGEAVRRLMQDGIATHFHVRVTTELRLKDVYVITAPNGVSARPVREESFFEFGAFGIGVGSIGAIDIGAPTPPVSSSPPQIPPAFRLMQILDGLLASPDPDPSPEAFAEMRHRIRRQLSAPLGPGLWIGSIDAPLTMRELCDTLEGGLDRPLIDETGQTGSYAISVHTAATTSDGFLRVLCEKLGLVMTPGRREVSTLMIRAE